MKNAKPIPDLKRDVLKGLAEGNKQSFEGRFKSNPLYMHSNGQQFPLEAFKDTLK